MQRSLVSVRVHHRYRWQAVNVPEKTKVLIGEATIGRQLLKRLSRHEKLTPVLGYVPVQRDFDDALDQRRGTSRRQTAVYGHTSAALGRSHPARERKAQ